MRALKHTLLIALVALLAHATGSPAASDSGDIVVTVDVASATNIDTLSQCATGTANVTDFGPVTPGSDNVTEQPCIVTFGSSNNTAMLRAYQTDLSGTAMIAPSTGALSEDGNWTGGEFTWRHGGMGTEPNDLIMDPDGKLVVAGEVCGPCYWHLQRFNPDGTTDFSTVHHFNGLDGVAHAAVRLSDGSYRLGGYGGTGGPRRPAFMAFEADGDVDTGWQASGELLTSDTEGHVFDVATFDDDAFVGVGSTREWTTNNTGDVVVYKLEADGDPYPGFGISGRTTFAVGARADQARAVKTLSDGSILVAGIYHDGSSWDGFVHKLTDNGSADPGFNGGSPRTFNLNGQLDAYAHVGLAVHADGSIVYGGGGNDGGDASAAIVRMSSTGVMDMGWGNSGVLIEEFSAAGQHDQITELLIEGDNTYVMSGWTGNPRDTFVARIDATTGNPDAGFSSDGSHTFDTNGSTWGSSDIVAHSNGDYYVVSRDSTDWGWIGRFDGISVSDFVDDPGDTTGNDWDTPDAGLFGACLVGQVNGQTDGSTWQPDSFDGADCLDGDDDPWEAIDEDNVVDADSNPKVMMTDAPNQTGGEAHIHFGFRTLPGQPPGWYSASITFEAVAPSV